MLTIRKIAGVTLGLSLAVALLSAANSIFAGNTGVPTPGADGTVLAADSASPGGMHWIAAPGGGDAFVANPLSQFASTTSAQLAGVISNETGSGALVFATTPTLVTPVLGAATATSINGLTITSSTGTLTITNAKTLAVSNSLTFTGTDSSSVAFGAGGTVVYNGGALGTPSSGTLTNATGLSDGGLTLTDVATNNSTTLAHGFLKKLDNVSTHFMDGTGAWSTPAGTLAGSDKQVIFNDGGSAFAGNAGLLFDKTAHTLVATGTVTGAGFNGTYLARTAVYTATATDYIIDCTANAFTVNLPTAASLSGRMYTVKNTQTANTCVIDPSGAETIDGASTVAVANGALTIVSDGTNWRAIGSLGLSIGAIAQGDLIYGSGAYTVSLLNKTGSAAILGNSASSNNPAWQTTIALAPIYLFNAGVCQNVTASIGTSLFTSSTPTARCVTGSNTTFGTAQFTATGQQIQGMLRAPADVSSTTVTISGQFFGETTSSGNTTFTFSFARVANAGTLDPAFTDCSDLTPAAGTANQLNSFSQTCTITGLTAGDLVFWKFRYKTAPTTPGNQDLINLAFIPLRSMTIGG